MKRTTFSIATRFIAVQKRNGHEKSSRVFQRPFFATKMAKKSRGKTKGEKERRKWFRSIASVSCPFRPSVTSISPSFRQFSSPSILQTVNRKLCRLIVSWTRINSKSPKHGHLS